MEFHFRSLAAAATLAALAGVGPVALAEAGTAPPIDLDFAAVCSEGSANFKMTNKGHAWPTAGNFNVYRVDGDRMVTQRRMRLAANQVVSFKVKATPGIPTALGLFVEPEWYSRDFRYDATLTC
jgi:hypothetical protein